MCNTKQEMPNKLAGATPKANFMKINNISSEKVRRCSLLFIGATAVLFILTAALKYASIALVKPSDLEPMINISMQRWYAIAATVEVGVVLLLLTPLPYLDKLVALRIFLSGILFYRFAAWLYSVSYCGCLGQYRLSGALQGHEGVVLSGLAIGLFVINEALIRVTLGAKKSARPYEV